VNKIGSLVRRRPVIWFYILACGITWGSVYGAYFLLPGSAFAFLTRNILPNGLPVRFGLMGILASYGPSLAGLIIAGVGFGRLETREWLARWVRWRVPWQWYAVALLSAPVLFVAQHLATHPAEFCDRLFLHPSPIQLRDGLVGGVLLVILYFPYIAGEEGGWRGFALPRLQAGYGPIGASCIIGVMWEAWHLPEILRSGNPYYDLGATAVTISLLRGLLIWNLYSLVCTWIFNHSRGSILPVILWHASTNAMVDTERYIFHPAGDSLPGHTAGDWILWPILALLLVGLTRGRLGYVRHPEPMKEKQVLAVGG
jgi:uncharacterized protein